MSDKAHKSCPSGRGAATNPAQGAETMTIDHEFKSHPDVFWPAARGEKTFEYRRDDRGGYEVGQTVRLRCYDPDHGYHSNPPLDRRITNILRGGEFELPMGYCILSLAPLASPRADSDERTAGEDLNDRLRAAGMFTIPEMMGETPLTRWEVHAAMKSLDAFGWWLDAQVRQYLTMKAEYDLAGKPEGDELYEWVLAHAAAFRTIRVNFEAARKATPAQPAGAVPDSLRALSEAATKGRFEVIRGLHHYIVVAEARGKNGLLNSADADFAAASANYVRTLLASHPAGQSAGSGAGCPECFGSGLRDIDGTSDDKCAACDGSGVPAPDRTRTGQVEATAGEIAHAAYYGHTPQSLRAGWLVLPQKVRNNWERAAAALAARPAAPEAQGAWRPMSEAPTDGSDFLAGLWVYGPSGVRIGWQQHFVRADDETERTIHPETYQGWDWDHYTHCLYVETPPPPAPPASSGQGGR